MVEPIGGISEVCLSLTLIVCISSSLIISGPERLAWFDSKITLAQATKAELLDRAGGLFDAVLINNVIIAVVDGLAVGVGRFLAGAPTSSF